MSILQNTVHRVNNLSFLQILLIGLSLTGGFLLFSTYRNVIISYLPYLILILCPLMHVFMHKGHGGKHENDQQ